MKIVLDRDEMMIDVKLSLSRAIYELKADVTDWEEILRYHPDDAIAIVATDAIENDKKDIEVLAHLADHITYNDDDSDWEKLLGDNSDAMIVKIGKDSYTDGVKD